jgi:hypothetical protein
VRALLSRKLPVVGNIDGTVAGLLVSYEAFQRLARDERARANEGTSTIAETARQLDCNTKSVRRLVKLEWLRASQTSRTFRVTEESIAEFKKRYVSILINRKSDQRCLVGAREHLQEMQPPNANCKAVGQEEQPGVHSRGAAARAALLANRAED